MPVRLCRRPALSAIAVAAVVAAVLMPAAAAAEPAHAAAEPPATTAVAAPTPPGHQRPADAHTVSYDGYSFMIDGKRTYIWSGEFHYYRLPSPDLWRDVLQKMKAAGFNATSIYFDWGYHSPRPGVYDFTGVRNVDKLLDIAQQVGIYVIARPGPYINAEVDGGGFPTWLTTKPGIARTDDPTYLAYADQWMNRINKILARHQLTNGTGTVIADQIENEYYNGDADGRAYMTHLENLARDDGITVPLTGNNNGTFNSGAGALDVDGPDSYPQGFNCSNPSVWRGVDDISYDHPTGKPLYTPEYQGGAFDPWGGPGYKKCAQLVNDQFANVFYKHNIAVGATAQNFYMLYGGTSWGWSAEPQNYTSYDYGAAIRESRQLDPKYGEDKLIGYFTQAVAPLTKTDTLAADPPENAAIVDTARINPDTTTQFHTLRHADSASTSTDSTHLAINLGAHSGYTYDDPASALHYSGAWTPVANQSYTGGDYDNTETFSDTAGDSVTIPFTGTGIRWISNRDSNHGIADVYLDGNKVDSVDLYGASKQSQIVAYRATGLTDGAHTLKIVVTGDKVAASAGTFVTIDAIDLPKPGAISYPEVPQQPGTAITLNGRESKIITANYSLGATTMRYSTSEIMTNAAIGNRDVAVLYGDKDQPGETVLHYASKPTVAVLGGKISSTWDASRGDLRLNYTHHGLTRVLVTGAGRPLLLLLADKATAETFWRADTANGPVLVRGSHLLRTATSAGAKLALSGDAARTGTIEVFVGNARSISWNGRRVQTQPTRSGSRLGVVRGARHVTLPALTNWKHQQGSPESKPAFDDSSWPVADHTTTESSTQPGSLPVLFADDYGFHTGNTWYRGRFTGTGKETGITLGSSSGGTAGEISVWLDGRFLRSAGDGSNTFTFPAGAVKPGAANVISVLTVDMGHDEDYGSNNSNKSARGLTSASINGAPLESITWRLQGTRGGEHGLDASRGPLNTGGLYGERAGWSLADYPDRDWRSTTLPAKDTTPGVSWYRTTVDLALPRNQDTSVGINIADSPKRHYRALIFVNGWQLGQYINNIGPEHSFPIPNGILNPHGKNTIAIAVWNTDASTGGLGAVKLVSYGSYASPLKVGVVRGSTYSRARYAMPVAGVRVRLHAPDTAAPSRRERVSATVSVPAGQPTASRITVALSVPGGWTATAPSPGSIRRITPGSSATVHWTVAVPSGTLPSISTLTATAHFTQRGRRGSASDERIVRSVPSAPSGTVHVSSLPFLSATNGWGPVERNTSNGENQPGDGKPITLNGAVYESGLGTNAVSDIQIYLGGQCTRFTSTVGVDDEVGSAGTVTFAVQTDGTTKVMTPVMTGNSASQSLAVDVSGAQVLDLVVGDGGDGNGYDHADWATPTLTCAS